MIPALLWKEWREQRWRCILGTLVLATIAGSLVRAQIITLPESLVLVFGPLGLLLAIFLAMGSVATEREDGTWDFLRARPVPLATILRHKWAIGAANLIAAFVIAGAAAHWAADSRGLFDLEPPPDWAIHATTYSGHALSALGYSVYWLWILVGLSLSAMLAWYTILFYLLTRARSELHAGLGGILLTLAGLAWMLQYPAAYATFGELNDPSPVFWTSALLNPLSPLFFIMEPPWALWLAAAIAVVGWTGGTVWFLMGRLERVGRLT